MKSRIAIALSLITILAVPFASGQSTSSVLGRLKVPFEFSVSKKVMPPGQYEVTRATGSSPHLMLRNLDTNTTVNMSVVERLARTDASNTTAKLIFNTVSDQKVLSEFWPSGNDDGYLLQVTKKEHKHLVVD